MPIGSKDGARPRLGGTKQPLRFFAGGADLEAPHCVARKPHNLRLDGISLRATRQFDRILRRQDLSLLARPPQPLGKIRHCIKPLRTSLALRQGWMILQLTTER